MALSITIIIELREGDFFGKWPFGTKSFYISEGNILSMAQENEEIRLEKVKNEYKSKLNKSTS